MIRQAALVAAVLLLGSAPLAGLPADSLEDAAQRAAETWLSLIDGAQYAASWAQAAMMLRRTVRPTDWERTVSAERYALGKVLSRKLRSRRYTERVLGAPAGRYVILEYDTVFEYRPVAVETVVPMLDSDGSWRVFGLFVR